MRNSCNVTRHRLSIRNLLLLLVALAVFFVCTFSFSAVATAKHTQAAQRTTRIVYESVYIDDGDSLWGIAQKYRGAADTEHFVEQVKALNGLNSDRIQAGAYILVPVETVL